MNGRYHKIPEIFWDHCPMLDILVTDAVYVEDENGPPTIQQPKPYSKSLSFKFAALALRIAALSAACALSKSPLAYISLH